MTTAAITFTRIRELHQPIEEEAEFWFDADGPSTYCEPTCTDQTCPGHGVKVQVCRECGYEHNGEFPSYRSWPCPTIRALDERGRVWKGDKGDGQDSR